MKFWNFKLLEFSYQMEQRTEEIITLFLVQVYSNGTLANMFLTLTLT